jgi:hypothetical protein
MMMGGKKGYQQVAKEGGVEMASPNSPSPNSPSSMEEGKTEPVPEPVPPSLSMMELAQLLLPYFWPSKGTDGAFKNRLRSTSTWMMVIMSKSCNLAAPFYISFAANALLAGHYYAAARGMCMYSTLRLGSSFFKEMQSILVSACACVCVCECVCVYPSSTYPSPLTPPQLPTLLLLHSSTP